MTEEDDFPGSGDIEITLEAEENEVLPHGYVFSGMQTDSGNGEFYEFTAGEDIEAAGWKYTVRY